MMLPSDFTLSLVKSVVLMPTSGGEILDLENFGPAAIFVEDIVELWLNLSGGFSTDSVHKGTVSDLLGEKADDSLCTGISRLLTV
jgi:hypothetical protein